MQNQTTKLCSMLLVFILLTLVFMGILVTTTQHLYQKTALSYEEAVSNTRLAETHSYAQQLAGEADMIMSRMNSCLTNSVLKQLLVQMDTPLPSTQYVRAAQYVWSLTNDIVNGSLFIDTVSIYILEKERKITNHSILGMTQEDWGLVEQMHQSDGMSGVISTQDGLTFWMKNLRQKGKSSIFIVAFCSRDSISWYMDTMFDNAVTMDMYLSLQSDTGAQTYVTSLSRSREMPTFFQNFDAAGRKSGLYTHSSGEQEQLITFSRVGNYPLMLFRTLQSGEMMQQINEYNRTGILAQLVSILIVLAFMLVIYLLVMHPTRQLQSALRQVELGNLNVRLDKTWNREFQYLFAQFNAMEEKIQNLVEHEYELKLLHKNAELKLFQYQINPHFLYNTYFALCGLINEEEIDHAASMANLMGRYLRYVTVSDQISGRLEEELEHARAYMEIQQMRFQKRMTSHMEECPPHCRQMQVPRLVVQPLIENAFEHGIKRKVQGGVIRVSFAESEGVFEIIVEDNGETITDEQIDSLRTRFRSDEYRGESVALINVDRRLAEFFGPKSGLRLERSALGGLKSIIHIDKEKGTCIVS